jgi:hypothetical protein
VDPHFIEGPPQAVRSDGGVPGSWLFGSRVLLHDESDRLCPLTRRGSDLKTPKTSSSSRHGLLFVLLREILDRDFFSEPDPLFAHEMWNQHDASLMLLPRSTNIAEGSTPSLSESSSNIYKRSSPSTTPDTRIDSSESPLSPEQQSGYGITSSYRGLRTPTTRTLTKWTNYYLR